MRKGANHSCVLSGPTNEFSIARSKLNEVLKEYSFAKIVEINYLPKTDTKHEFFYGRCEVLSNSRMDINKGRKVIFFDKAGRNKQDFLQIGPCKLVDSAWGKEHSSAKVDVGDIIVGIQSNNPRQGTNIDKVLKNWSKHGKIIMEASRLVEYGTKLSITEISKLLIQKECELAEQAQSFPQSFFHNSVGGYISKENLKKLAVCRDDFYYLLKVVLWGDLRDLAVLHSIQNKEGMRCKNPPLPLEEKKASLIQLSENSLEFITLLSSKLEDPTILGKFYDLFDEIFYPPSQTLPIEPKFDFNYQASSITPKYFPSSPCGIFSPESPTNFPKSPNLIPSSPPYVPKSPAFIPKSPEYVPKSPEFILKSPETSPPNINITYPVNTHSVKTEILKPDLLNIPNDIIEENAKETKPKKTRRKKNDGEIEDVKVKKQPKEKKNKKK